MTSATAPRRPGARPFTATDGLAKLDLGKLDAGAWRIRYTTVDDFGATYETFRDFLVAGGKETPAVPLVLLVESGSVRVGETARLLATSGLPGQPMLLERFRAGKLLSRTVLKAGEGNTVLEIPVTEADRGGFGVTLSALRDHQWMSQTAAVFVPWDDRELKLEFATFRDRIRPGTRETWRVTVKSPLRKARRGRRGGAPRLHVRPEPRRLRAAPAPRPSSRSTRRASGRPGRARRSGRRRPSGSIGSFDADPVRRPRSSRTGSRSSTATASAGPGARGRRFADARARWARRSWPRAWRWTPRCRLPPRRRRRRRRWRRWRRTRKRDDTKRGEEGRRRASPRRGRAARPPEQLRRDGVLDAAAPDGGRRLGVDRVHRPRLRHVLERLGPRRDEGPARRLAEEGDEERQGADGPALRPALPARGGPGRAEGRRQQRVRGGAEGEPRVRDPRPRDERGPLRPLRPLRGRHDAARSSSRRAAARTRPSS